MDVMRLERPNGYWNAPAYSARVRGERYLWGSAGLTVDLQFDKPFILHIENDRAGEAVTIGTRLADGAKTDLGTIQPGEFLSVPVNNIVGVYAASASETLVHCLIC